MSRRGGRIKVQSWRAPKDSPTSPQPSPSKCIMAKQGEGGGGRIISPLPPPNPRFPLQGFLSATRSRNGNVYSGLTKCCSDSNFKGFRFLDEDNQVFLLRVFLYDPESNGKSTAAVLGIQKILTQCISARTFTRLTLVPAFRATFFVSGLPFNTGNKQKISRERESLFSFLRERSEFKCGRGGGRPSQPLSPF